jgi:5-methylcytosine-specific restriction endonuclease McrA
MPSAEQLIGSILTHDAKQNTYKIALVRSINDVVLAHAYFNPPEHTQVAIPLRLLAQQWMGYYWGFMDEEHPIYQGNRRRHRGALANDMAFRPHLTQLRETWENFQGTPSLIPDGYILANEMQVHSIQRMYAKEYPALIRAYNRALHKIIDALEQPIRYAGTQMEGEHNIFRFQRDYRPHEDTHALPTTQIGDPCILLSAEMWVAFRRLSVWVEARSVYEWAMFLQNLESNEHLSRGDAFDYLTQRPEKREGLTWERDRVLELFDRVERLECPWTGRNILHQPFQLDHLIPIAVYPMNEMWNLIPTHPPANLRKSHRIPSDALLQAALPRLMRTYQAYHHHPDLAGRLREDTQLRFGRDLNPSQLAPQVVGFLEQVARHRALPRVENF